MQKILFSENQYAALSDWLLAQHSKRIFLVCDSALPFLKISDYFSALEAQSSFQLTRFDAFTPNPTYPQVTEGIQRFSASCCDTILAVGGGSAIDVAKCIKLYAYADLHKNLLTQPIQPNQIPFLAIPTTAGTGSEATRYAVIYYQGEKQSITHESCIPAAVLFDPSALKTLPLYQRKATLLDALCHAVESFWSVNSTPESRRYSQRALADILAYKDAYLDNTESGNINMLQAAYTAGKAINITQTTAGHAMCYKLTSLYGIAHGHAAALCVAALWPYMLDHLDRCVDKRGKRYLDETLLDLAKAMKCETPAQAAEKFAAIVTTMQLPAFNAKPQDIPLLTASVNITRLGNHPILLARSDLELLYQHILQWRQA